MPLTRLRRTRTQTRAADRCDSPSRHRIGPTLSDNDRRWTPGWARARGGASLFTRHVKVGFAFATVVVCASCGPTSSGTPPLRTAPAGPVVIVPTAAVLLAVRAGSTVNTIPKDLHPSLTQAALDGPRLSDTDCARSRRAHSADFGQCVYGDAAAHREVVLLGDSHAGMWFDGLNAAARAAHWRLQIFTLSGCRMPSLNYQSEPYLSNSACASFRSSAIRAIRKIHPSMVVVTSGTYYVRLADGKVATASEWATGLAKTLTMLQNPGTSLVVLGDIPLLREDDADCLSTHQSAVRSCDTPRSAAFQHVLVSAERAAAQTSRARYVSPGPWLCAATCPPIIDDTLVFRDRHHITATYSLYLAGALEAALGLKPAS